MPAPAVAIWQGPPTQPGWTSIQVADSGATFTEYMALAASVQPIYEVSIGALSLTSVVVLTNVGTVNWTAHGLRVGNKVAISGATVDTDLTATYVVATVPDANSFTIATVNVADGTYNNTALTVSTTAPRTNQPIWSINKTIISGANTWNVWANGLPDPVHIFDSRTTYGYQ